VKTVEAIYLAYYSLPVLGLAVSLAILVHARRP